MNTQEYWFAVEGEPHGPVTLEELSERYRSRVVGPQTLIWFQGLPQWQPLSQTELRHCLQRVPPPLPRSAARKVARTDLAAGAQLISQPHIASPAFASDSSAHAGSSACTTGGINEAATSFALRPTSLTEGGATTPRAASYGQRIAARVAEVMVWYLPVAALIGVAMEFGGLDVHPQVAAWLLISLALAAEALCLHLFGNSVGKALVGIRAVRTDGAAWDGASAFRRAFGLWAWGMLFGAVFLFPVLEDSQLRMVAGPVALAPFFWQSIRVLSGKPTHYDEGRFVVYRHRTHWWRTLAVLAFALITFAITVGAWG